MTNVVEDFKRTKKHPMARCLIKYPLVLLFVASAILLGLAFIGGSAINISLVAGAARTPYQPTDANETRRIDMWINAQRTVDKASVEAERQTTAFSGFTFIFEAVLDDGSPDLEADIFSVENLRVMRAAQAIIEGDRRWESFCLRCPIDPSPLCRKVNSTYDAADAVISAILDEESDASVLSLATELYSEALQLEALEGDTAQIRECAEDVLGAYSGGGTVSINATLDKAKCARTGALATSSVVCDPFPGCEDSNKFDQLCMKAYSPLGYFCKDKGVGDCDEWNDLDDAWEKLDKEIDTPGDGGWEGRVNVAPASFYLPRSYTKRDKRAHTVRMTLPCGLPIDGFLDQYDRSKEQEAEVESWLVSKVGAIEAFREAALVSHPNLAFRWVSTDNVLNPYFENIIAVDTMFALAAILFVFLYISWHTRSPFIAGTSLLGVVLCFPVGAFWSIVVFQVKFFDPLNIFLIFILLGLGADGVFIVFDAWEQSKEGLQYWLELHGEAEAHEYRMSFVWRRASTSMFACNVTTALAFCATIPSPIMPMAAFGTLAACVIIHNWALDVTVVPAIIVVWDRYIRHRYCCVVPRGAYAKLPCALLPGCKPRPEEADEASLAHALKQRQRSRADKELEAAGAEAGGAKADGAEGEHGSLNRTEAFFREKYAPFIINYRKPILLVMTLVIGTFVFFTTQLEPDREAPQLLPNNHPLWKAILSLRDGWMVGDSEPRSELWLVWGIKDLDASGFSKFEYDSPQCNDGPCGEAVWDSSFDPSSTSMQEFLSDICDTAARQVKAPGAGGVGNFVYKREVATCMFEDFKKYLKGRGKDFPVEDEDDFWDELRDFLKPPKDSDSAAGAGYSYVQRELVKIDHADDGQRMYFLISGVTIDFNPLLFYGIPDVLPGHTAALEFEREYAYPPHTPKGNAPFFVTTKDGLFAELKMQQAYISSTVDGVMIALAFAFVSLMAFVANLVVGVLAFLCIAGVVCCTLGLMVLQGWKLGLIEAICATIVVGFSVDYIVHFALAYVNAPQRDRNGRLTHALVEVGISVLSGAVTTMGASIFLLFTTVQFYFKFGLFMLSTIFFSLMTANLAFTALLATIGPEDDFADIAVLIAKLTGGRVKVGRASEASQAPAGPEYK